MSVQSIHQSSYFTRIILVTLVALLVAGFSIAGTGVVSATDRPASTLVVDGEFDGDDEYGTIQAAVDNASAGATVRVQSGTYSETLTISKNVTLVAPDGAALDGGGGESTVGIRIESDSPVEPTISGFTVRNYRIGIDAASSDGSWTVQNVTVTRNAESGIRADDATGNWRIENAVVTDNGGAGVSAVNASAAWTIRNAELVGNSQAGVDATGTVADWRAINLTVTNNSASGVTATGAAGDWTIRSTRLVDNGGHGVTAAGAGGTWTVRNSTVRGNSRAGIDADNTSSGWRIRYVEISANGKRGLSADRSTGQWELRESTVSNNTGSGVSAIESDGRWIVSKVELTDNAGDGVAATGTTGPWRVTNSILDSNARAGIDATDATVEGNATRNWWGTVSGPDTGDCVGHVDCTNWLGTNPAADGNGTPSGSNPTSEPTSGSPDTPIGGSIPTVVPIGVGLVVILSGILLYRRVD